MDAEVDSPPLSETLRATQWMWGWRRYTFPAIFLVFALSTARAVPGHASGAEAVVAYVLLAAFCAAYMGGIYARFGGHRRAAWASLVLEVVLLVPLLTIAHQDAIQLTAYLVVGGVALLGTRALPLVAALTAITLVVPTLVPSWHAGLGTSAALTDALLGVAMVAYFATMESNRALRAAHAEMVRLAAENERSRIARDLHDLLGHSLTTITVKAGLARRLSERDPDAAAREIVEVECLARRSLGDVRCAVSNFRDVTLGGELATAREVLRAAGIEATLPAETDIGEVASDELFGWVVREGMTNVVRHAHATRCSVTLDRDVLEIVDNGTAMAGPVTRPSTGGHGITGLRERVEAAGGRLMAGPASPRGWRLRVELAPGPPALGMAGLSGLQL